MRILDDIPFEIDPEQVFELLHLDPQHRYASEVNALIDRARQLARPRAVYEVAFIERKETDSVVIAGDSQDLEQAAGRRSGARQSAAPRPSSSTRPGAQPGRARFVSQVLRANLDEVERVFPYVATCGRELDSTPVADGDVFSQFCWDAIKEMALHVALSHLFDHLKEVHELESLSSMNPGSGDMKIWPIEQQKELFAFFGDVEDLIGVVLTDSCLMIPTKSVSGLFFSSEHGFESCQLCHRNECPRRRAPFDPHLWEERCGRQP
jgi:hypothetical protein